MKKTLKSAIVFFIIITFSFLTISEAGIHQETNPVSIADTAGTADAIIHYRTARGRYSFQTPSGRFYVFFIESNTAIFTLKYATSTDGINWIVFDTSPEIDTIASSSNWGAQASHGQLFAVVPAPNYTDPEYCVIVYQKEDFGVYTRSGLINNWTGEIYWLSALKLANITGGDNRAFSDICFDTRPRPWISSCIWNGSVYNNYIWVLDEALPSSGTNAKSIGYNPFGNYRTFLTFTPYKPLNASVNVGFMYVFALRDDATTPDHKLHGIPLTQTGDGYIDTGEDAEILEKPILYWRDTNNYDFPFFSVVGEVEHTSEASTDRRFIHLIYKNRTVNSTVPYGTLRYAKYEAGLGWGSETIIYQENASLYQYIRHPSLTLVRPSSKGLNLLLHGSRPNSTNEAHIYYFEYINGTWGNFTELCGQENDFGNIYHSEILSQDFSLWEEGINQTIPVYWNDDNSGDDPENRIRGLLAETDEWYSTPEGIEEEEEYESVIDEYTFPFIGLIGIIMMCWSPTWVALKYRSRKDIIEVIETGAYAMLVFLVGLGMFLSFIYG